MTTLENIKQSKKNWRDANKEHIRKYELKYNSTPEGRFKQQKAQAKKREILWLLSFDQWWRIWEESGKWLERGYSKGKYCMCRFKDQGPYSIENVKIDTAFNNKSERWENSYTMKPVQNASQLVGTEDQIT